MRAHLFLCTEDVITETLQLLDGEYYRGHLELSPEHFLVPMPVATDFRAHNQLADQLKQLLKTKHVQVFPIIIPPEDTPGILQKPGTQQRNANFWIRARTDRDFGLTPEGTSLMWEGIQFETTTVSQPRWAGLHLPEKEADLETEMESTPEKQNDWEDWDWEEPSDQPDWDSN